jgi:hypothetical protein
VDYSSWPIKELRRFLTERGQDPSGIVEKDDLVAKVCMCGRPLSLAPESGRASVSALSNVAAAAGHR